VFAIVKVNEKLRVLQTRDYVFRPLGWTKCKEIQLRVVKSVFLVAGRTALETKHVTVPKINEKHRVRVKNT
jgi:hypothetical protein